MAFQSSTWLPIVGPCHRLKTHISVSPPRKVRRPPSQIKANLPTAENTTPSPRPTLSAKSPASSGSYNWLEQWFPITFEENLKDNEMHAFRIFDKAYILLRDATDSYTVMDDVCPHRAAPLSEGRVFNRETPEGKQTVIECGYHGWRFGCDGACLDVPIKQSEPSKSARVRGVYKTGVAPFGLVFVWLGDPDNAPPLPIPKDLLSERKRPVIYFRTMQRRIPLPFDILLENLVDPAHVPWSHHKVDGDRRRENSAVRSVPVTEHDSNLGYFRGNFVAPPVSLNITMRGNHVEYSGFLDENGEPRFFFPLWVVPESRNMSRIVATRILFEPPLLVRIITALTPRWRGHIMVNLVLDGDSPLLHTLNRHLENVALRTGKPGWRSQYLLSETKCDTMVVEFRKWFDSVRDQVPFNSPPLTQVPDPISRYEMNDRYRWHVKDCAICSTALRNFRIVGYVSRTIAAFAILACVTTTLCAMALAAGQPAGAEALARYARRLFVVSILMICSALIANRAVSSFTYTNKARHLLTTPDTTF